MSAEQKRKREQASEAYRSYSRLPKADQTRLRKAWFDRHPGRELAKASEEPRKTPPESPLQP